MFQGWISICRLDPRHGSGAQPRGSGDQSPHAPRRNSTTPIGAGQLLVTFTVNGRVQMKQHDEYRFNSE